MAIGYNRLGSNGRLGNQMFQYAALRGIAEKNGYSWVIPKPDSYGDSNYGLFDCFEMSTVSEKNFGFVNGQSVQTGYFHFHEEFFSGCPDNVNLHDYFQTEKYFENILDTIKKDYTFKKEIIEPCLEVIGDLNNPIFIHVRRGDYLNQPDNHPTCPRSYYEKSLELFDKESPVLVFSDDLEWCRENFTDDRFLISTENPIYNHTSDTNNGRVKSFIPYYDLCMMSMCVGGIIANSSMSWWGAWLIESPTQPIVAPSPWFGKNYSHFNMNDLIPDRWVIENV
tara:strand:+ start:13486 stop:14328 length:843 start_codon:yes stop_codon:yes gene_type:complete